MKKKHYTPLFLVIGTAVITFLIVHFLTPAVIKESFARWGSMRLHDMTISDALALILVVFIILQHFKILDNESRN
tara:strand:- start:59053 stop:59277 length:225 start_codon:yes stop_codon:yes gene_type:complete